MLAMAALTGSNREQALKSASQPQEDQTRPGVSLLDSPRLFRHLLTNYVENADSPTSMLDTKQIFSRRALQFFIRRRSILPDNPLRANTLGKVRDLVRLVFHWSFLKTACVISHGPNPKTTRIFDNFGVESYSGFLSPLKLKKRDSCLLPDADALEHAAGGSSIFNNCEPSVKDSR